MSDLRYFPKILFGIPHYLLQKNSTKPIIIGMAMQVKNEADIIELNIRYHALKGVSKFFIMDNNSTDGTWEILQQLKGEYNITVMKDTVTDYKQAINMTWLSEIAKKQGVDICIQNDADEFWYPLSGSLMTNLNRQQTVLRVKRVNVLPLLHEPNNSLHSPWVTGDVVLHDHSHHLSSHQISFLHRSVLHKVMTNCHGLIAISGGNHDARHCWDKIRRKSYGEWNHNILIFHHALRSFKQFQIKAKAILESLNYSKMKNEKKHNFSKDAVNWANAFQQGDLRKVYDNMLLDIKDIDTLEKFKIIAKDSRLITDMKKHNLILGSYSKYKSN